ncbi:hypothetical protein PDE_00745 [Penicillium oxalicum 114-2]|uniref:Uncharacterized protein n=1 Tax=Penicillium oxalicum (strain 114-2 / CGMCC 5302) TaxID=933388 RepID=S7Z6Q3_PENO1|nr:hypothetical protein PDE_00745 [Penicillium oxalicum 114-2]
MNPNLSCPDSLTQLSALVEQTLIETGRMFRRSNASPASTHVQRSVPTYYDGFQDALDNLSEQIFIAKAFLERDYGAIKTRETVHVPNEDVSMSEIAQKSEASPEIQRHEPVDSPTKPLKVESTADENPPATLTTPAVAASHNESDEQKMKTEEKDPEPEPTTDQTFLGSGEGMKFDVLNEGGAHNSFDLNYDFGNDDTGNQAFLSGTSFGNPTPSADKGGPGVSSNHNPAAPTGGGAFDMELGKTDGNLNSFTDPTNGMDDMIGPGESSFDDLFMENDNMGGGGGDLQQLEGNSLMGINEMDDSWFS